MPPSAFEHMMSKGKREKRKLSRPSFVLVGPSPTGQRPVVSPENCEVISGIPFLSRKEVIQPHLPVRLPCYDFTPLTRRSFGTVPLAVGLATSATSDSDGVTGGVYKARERIHRAMLMRDY